MFGGTASDTGAKGKAPAPVAAKKVDPKKGGA
jgi:hypothetical protein